MVQAIPATSSLGVPARVDVSVKAHNLKLHCAARLARKKYVQLLIDHQRELICCSAAAPSTSRKRCGRANATTPEQPESDRICVRGVDSAPRSSEMSSFLFG